MNVIRPEDCPDSLQLTDAIDIAYGSVLGEVIRRLQSGISVLIECEKDLGIASNYHEGYCRPPGSGK
jgi:hypothetical protein